MKNITLLTLLISLCLGITLNARPKPGDADYFPISIWTGTDWLAVPLEQHHIDDMAEAGITVAGYAVSKQDLAMIEKAGMTAWVLHKIPPELFNNDQADEAALRQAVRDTVAEYSDVSNFCGYWLQDEPPARRFRVLGIVNDEIKKVDPTHRTYINLLPNYATPQQLGAPNFLEYARKFVSEVHPDRIGYDFYTLYEDENQPLHPGYWKQLAETRQVAQENGIPFEVCVLSVGHLIYRIPSETDLFFEVYSALLYGAKGIFYFTYFTPKNSSYRHAPVDSWGNRTETWYAMRYVNNTVHCIARTLNRLESTKVYHFQPGEPMPFETPAPNDSIIEAPADPSQRIAVGEFKDRETGEKYIMILNKNLKRTININGLKWRFGKPANVMVCSQFKKDLLSPFGGENAWVAPGQALLLKL